MKKPAPKKPAQQPKATAAGALTSTRPTLPLSRVALMLTWPALAGAWWWYGRGAGGALDASLGAWTRAELDGLAPVGEVLRWPFAKGWVFAALVLVLAFGLRMSGRREEAQLVLGVQGALLLSFSALTTVCGDCGPRLDVMLYVGLAASVMMAARWDLPPATLTGLGFILTPLYLVFMLSLAASGAPAGALALSTLMGLFAALSLGARD